MNNPGISQALGTQKADLVIKNANIFHLTTGEFETGDIAVCGDRIVGVGLNYSGEVEFDATNLTAVPGFIDAHCHVESSMLTPYEFERCVLPHGTTSAVCDPHELTNVAGIKALEYFSDSASGMIMSLIVRISSCVPATHMETSGATLTATEMAAYLKRHPGAGLSEMMNVPGVLTQDPEVMAKLALCKHCDGHAPLVGGHELNAYITAGILNDHEASSCKEALEKLRRGMRIFIREGSAAHNLDMLAPLITLENAPFLAFCTDDREPLDIVGDGHIDSMIRRAIALGASPLAAYRVASFSAAQNSGLNDRGILAPGYLADIVLLDSLRECSVKTVFKSGQIVDAARFARRTAEPDHSQFLHSVKVRRVSAQDFAVHSSKQETPVIGIKRGDLLTEHLTESLVISGGLKQAAPERDILKIAVLERHGKNGNIGLGFVRGFSLKDGALASSVGHDSHNICVVGTNDADMALAVNEIAQMQGGWIAVRKGRVLTALPLPLGGLMSEIGFEELAKRLEDMHRIVGEFCLFPHPFQMLSFLPLPVIPHLKLTDMGMVDVDQFRIINL